MIHITYGMLKSASTLAYQMTEEILRQAGRTPVILGPPFRPALSVTNYFDDIDLPLIERLTRLFGTSDIVLKTHQLPAPGVLAMIERGDILASATFRDPREVALSMVDHGARSRRWSIPEFSECETVFDCCASIDNQIAVLRAWCAIAPVERIAYDDICFDMRAVIARLSERMGVRVDTIQVERAFADKKLIGQFNKGVPGRFHEMTAEQSAHFLNRYAGFHEDFLPDPDPSRHIRPALQASGQLRQSVIGLRRLWHSRASLTRAGSY